MNEGYGWSQLSQWDSPPKDAHIEFKKVDTGLSNAICKYMLVYRTKTNDGYLRCEYVKKDDVSQSIINDAGNY